MEQDPAQNSDEKVVGTEVAGDSQATCLSRPLDHFEVEEEKEEDDDGGDEKAKKGAAGLQMQEVSAALAVQEMGAIDEGQKGVVKKERQASGRKKLVTEHRIREPVAEVAMKTVTEGDTDDSKRMRGTPTRLDLKAERDDAKAGISTAARAAGERGEASEAAEAPDVAEAEPVLPPSAPAALPEEEARFSMGSQEGEEAAGGLLPSSTEGHKGTEGGDDVHLRRQSGGGSTRSTAQGLAARKTIIVTKEVGRSDSNKAGRKGENGADVFGYSSHVNQCRRPITLR